MALWLHHASKALLVDAFMWYIYNITENFRMVIFSVTLGNLFKMVIHLSQQIVNAQMDTE